jgi:RNA polymerase sigma factor (sigma-70 family)
VQQHGELVQHGWQRTGDAQAAHDVAQSAIAAALERPHLLRPDASVRLFLHNHVRNEARGRNHRARKERPVDWEAVPDDLEPEGPGETPLENCTREEREADLVRAIELLPAAQRETIRLVDLLGLTIAEAARVRNVTPAAVWRARKRALESLLFPDQRK